MRLAALVALSLLSGLVGAAPATSQKVSPAAARELLSGVCESGAEKGMCTPCPAFTTMQSNSEYFKSTVPGWVIYGKFTDPNRTDALLDMSGCEQHANNFGGSLLLRWQGLTSWKLTRYLPSYRTNQCLTYPARDGRDLLLCQGYYGGGGTVIESLVLSDVGRSDAPDQLLLSTEDSGEGCEPSGSIQSLRGWKAVPGGRYPGLRVTVRSAAYTRAGDKGGVPCSGALTITPSRTYTLDYAYDGVKFTLTPASKAAYSALLSDNPNLD